MRRDGERGPVLWKFGLNCTKGEALFNPTTQTEIVAFRRGAKTLVLRQMTHHPKDRSPFVNSLDAKGRQKLVELAAQATSTSDPWLRPAHQAPFAI